MIRKFFITIFVCISMAAPPPAWLYASGNTPYMPFNSGEMAAKIKATFPKTWEVTYQISHEIGEHLRNELNVGVPPSVNERTKTILETHQRVIGICDGVLKKIDG